MDNTLDQYRNDINNIDNEIVNLLAKRSMIVKKIGEYKHQHGLPIVVPEREKALVDKLRGNNEALIAKGESAYSGKAIKNIYREIISASVAIEDEITVSFLGPIGTYSHAAAIELFGSAIQAYPVVKISEVFEDVAYGRTMFGVVPFDNSIEGVVGKTIANLNQFNVCVEREIFLNIQHYLLNQSGNIKLIKKVVSHEQALGQCSKWIETNLPNVQVIQVDSTAAAAQLASKDGTIAAIASDVVRTIYDLRIVAKNIANIPVNKTRFLVISNKIKKVSDYKNNAQSKEIKDSDYITSVFFSLKDKAGSLVDILNMFAKIGVNLSKIDSRPSGNVDHPNIFYLDIDAYAGSPNINNILHKLENELAHFKLIGSYLRDESHDR